VDGRHQILILFLVADRNRAIVAVQEQPHPRGAALYRTDCCHRAHAIEDLWGHVLEVLALRDHKDLFAFVSEGGLDGAQGPGTASRDWRGDLGKEHSFA
jgi:hypothetical protein